MQNGVIHEGVELHPVEGYALGAGLLANQVPPAPGVLGGQAPGAPAAVAPDPVAGTFLDPHNPPRPSRFWARELSAWCITARIIYCLYLGLFLVYAVLRAKDTLRTAVNPEDTSVTAEYRLSAYPVICLVLEIMGMVSMAIFAISKTYLSDGLIDIAPFPDLPMHQRYGINVAVCCFEEETVVIQSTLRYAAKALEEAALKGMVDVERSCIWLCDDTPANPRLARAPPDTWWRWLCCRPIDEEALQGALRAERVAMIANLRNNPDYLVHLPGVGYFQIQFAHRLPDDPLRAELYMEVGGQEAPGEPGKKFCNPKSCNLNSAFQAMYRDRPVYPGATQEREWGARLTEEDLVVFLDADQQCTKDFLTKVLPCFTTAIPGDNLVMVQTPQVFRGVHPTFDIANHQNIDFFGTMMPSYNMTGFISCAGTNFVMKAKALRSIGREPFPTHTVTEDFAFGMRMRAQNPPMSAMYLPLELVTGDAPDLVRKLFKQHSRWAKGAFKMLTSRNESPLRYKRRAGPHQTLRPLLSMRDRISFVAPVYNVVLNAMLTPFFCFVPIFHICSGHFPAAMTTTTTILAIILGCITLFFKYCGKPSAGVHHVVWQPDNPAEPEKLNNGEVERRPHDILSYVRSEWNADQRVRVEWWMFSKIVLNQILEAVGCKEASLLFKSTGTGDSHPLELLRDLVPLLVLWLALMVGITFATLQYWTGVRLIGPLGISMALATYMAIPFGNQLLYVVCGVRHDQAYCCCGCYASMGKTIFVWLYSLSFVASWLALIMAGVFAAMTNHHSYSQNQILGSDGQLTVYWRPLGETFHIIRSQSPPWIWHW